MNKMSTRMLVVVGLIVLLVCSWYTLINDNAKVNQEYNQHITVAREKLSAGLHQLAIENFEKARAIKDSIALRDEMANTLLAFGNATLYQDFCNQIIQDYPYEKVGYEHLATYYNSAGEYTMFFNIKKELDKRGVASDVIAKIAKDLEYAYSLDGVSAVEIGGYSGGYYATLRSKGYWGLLNERGKGVLSFSYVKLSNFANGVIYAETKDGQYVLVDKTGKIISRVTDGRKIEDCSTLNAGKMAVKYNGKYHYCDDSFKELFGSYDYASVFAGGVAAVMNDGKWAIINEKGEKVTDFVFDDIVLDDIGVAFRNNRAFAKKGNAYILIDASGKQVGNASWEEVDAYSNEMIAAVKKGGKWGFVDADGKEVLACQYQGAKSFYNGMAAVQINGSWGYITIDGVLRIEARFTDARDFTKNGAAYVKDDAQWYVLKLYRTA